MTREELKTIVEGITDDRLKSILDKKESPKTFKHNFSLFI